MRRRWISLLLALLMTLSTLPFSALAVEVEEPETVVETEEPAAAEEAAPEEETALAEEMSPEGVIVEEVAAAEETVSEVAMTSQPALDISIDVPDITRYDTDRSIWDGQAYIDCYPDWVSVTINGDTCTGRDENGDLNQVRDALGQLLENHDLDVSDYDLRWESGEDADHLWTSGTHTAYVRLTIWTDGASREEDPAYDVVQEYTVTVIPTVIESVSVHAIVRTSADKYEDWDGEQYDCYPNYIEVVTTDGETFSGHPHEVEEQLYQMYPDTRLNMYWESDQSKENPWEVGKTYSASYFVAGVEGKYDVVIKDRAFDQVIVNLPDYLSPIVRTENDRRLHGTWDEENGRIDYENEANLIDCWPGSEDTTVTLTWGEEDSITLPIDPPYDVEGDETNNLRDWLRANGYRDDVDWASDETANKDGEGNWEPGKHEAFLVVSGVCSAPYPVYVVADPIEEVIVPEGMKVLLSDHRGDEEDVSTWEWDVFPENITVVLKESALEEVELPEEYYELTINAEDRTVTGNLWDVRDFLRDIFDYDVDVDWYHDRNQESYHAGDQLHCYITFAGNERGFYTVELVDANVSALSVADITRYNSDRTRMDYYDEETDEYLDGYTVDAWPEEITAVVNGKIYIGDPDEVAEEVSADLGVHIKCYWETDEDPRSPWENGTYTARFHFGGLTEEYEVTVVPVPFESITVNPDPLPVMAYDDGWLDIDPETITATATNGATKTAEPNSIREWAIELTAQQYPDAPEVRAYMDFDIAPLYLDALNEGRAPTEEEMRNDQPDWREGGNWEPGGVYKAVVSFSGLLFPYQVKAIDHADLEIISVEGMRPDYDWGQRVQVFKKLEMKDRKTGSAYFDFWSNEWVSASFPMFDIDPGKITVNYRLDGGEVQKWTGTVAQLSKWLMEDYGKTVYCVSDQSPTNQWTTGRHEAALRIDRDEFRYQIQVLPTMLTGATVTAASPTYTGKALNGVSKVVLGKVTLKQGKDYTVTCKNNINAGTATYTIKGINDYRGTITGTFTIKKANQSLKAVAKVNPILKDGATTITVSGAVGKVTYVSGKTAVATVNASGKVTGKGVGVATITVTAAGDANRNKASVKVSVVVLQKAALSSVKNNKAKTVTAVWKKVAGVTGYQIQYSVNKKFSGAKTVTVKGAGTTSKAIGSLAKGKGYYFRIRTYITTGGKNYYSAWSGAKGVKISK